MVKKRIITLSLLLVFANIALWSQAEQQENADFSRFNTAPKLSAQQILQEVSISQFSDLGFWKPQLARDYGYLTIRRFTGGPNLDSVRPLTRISSDEVDLENNKVIEINGNPIRLQNDVETEDERFILGGKALFSKRGLYSFSVTGSSPIHIDGYTKEISFWAAGRGVGHKINIIIEDAAKKTITLPVGTLAFNGWNRMSVPLPLSIKQFARTGSKPAGIKIKGFVIDTDLDESYGEFYFYIDDLRAVVDLYAYTGGDEDDPSDQW